MKTTVLSLLSLMLLSSTVFSQQQVSSVRAILQREISERAIPGLQIAVVHKGKIVLSESYGIANVTDQIPVDQNTIFAINSCTKVFSAVAMMQLVEQGKVVLNSPIATYLDSLPEAWKKVSIQQILTHSSGLPDLLKLLDNRTGGLGTFKDEQAIWIKLKTLPMEFQPGERFSYNQTNAYLVGKIIEHFEKKPFAESFSEKQFIPLGMQHTIFGDSRDVIPHFAPTYFYRTVEDGRILKDKKLINNYYEFPYFRRTASGLNSSAQDMAKWIIALQSGKLLKSKETLHTMWSPITFNNGNPTPWALGWGMNKFRVQHKAVGMSGGGRAAFLVYPDDDLAVIVLTNLGGSYPEDFLEEIAGCYVPGILKADPVTFLRTNLRTIGYEKAIELTDRERLANPQFKPNEFELNEWAYRMMAKNQLKEAKAILELNVHLFPSSWNAYDSYADVLMKSGENKTSVLMYKKSLELNPNNDHAIKILTGLGQL
jgi:CubicO group peptidase (beta-lactamase class C family)